MVPAPKMAMVEARGRAARRVACRMTERGSAREPRWKERFWGRLRVARSRERAGNKQVRGNGETMRTYGWRSSMGWFIFDCRVPSAWGKVFADEQKRILEQRLYLPERQ